jgi:hypothetical protein
MPELRFRQEWIKECPSCGRWSGRLRGEDRLEDFRCVESNVWMTAVDPDEWFARAIAERIAKRDRGS